MTLLFYVIVAVCVTEAIVIFMKTKKISSFRELINDSKILNGELIILSAGLQAENDRLTDLLKNYNLHYKRIIIDKMNLPDVLFISSKEIPGGELILSTSAPYYVARAFKFESQLALEEFVIKHNIFHACEVVPGYNILICYTGTISNVNEKIMLGHLVPGEAKPFLKEARSFYEKERIKGNETRFKKFER